MENRSSCTSTQNVDENTVNLNDINSNAETIYCHFKNIYCAVSLHKFEYNICIEIKRHEHISITLSI
jgi:hypothetical protein